MRSCLGCPEHVPAVSLFLARRIAARLGDDERRDVIARCARWLTEKHPGLHAYLGILGRPYTEEERVWIATEEWAVEQTPCPFAIPGGCALRGIGTAAEVASESTRREFFWLPTALLMVLDPGALGYLIRFRLSADAKVSGLSRRGQFPIPGWSSNQPYQSSSPTTQTREVNDDGAIVQAGAH